MKAFVAALVAIGIPYAVDREYSDGRSASDSGYGPSLKL
jgi:hypothetical protein